MALGDRALTAGTLRPALTTPPDVMCGAVAETGVVTVSVKVAFPVTPVADAVIVNEPAVLPSVTLAFAVPSFRVIAGDGDTVAAPAGLMLKFTMTPGTPAPLASTTCTVRGVFSTALVLPV